MLTFSTLATRVSWTTDFCKGELKKSQMEQNTAENEAHVSSTMEPLGKMQKKLIQKYQIQSHTINSVSLLQQYIIILLSLLLLLLLLLLLQRIHKIFPYKFYEGEQGTTIKRIVSKLLM